jgi:hypothetical protein
MRERREGRRPKWRNHRTGGRTKKNKVSRKKETQKKQKKDSTQSKNPRESTSQTKTTQRGVLLLPLLSSL